MSEATYYNVHNFVTLRSETDVPIPEFFATDPISDPDIRVSIGSVRYDRESRQAFDDKYFWDPDARSLVVDWGKNVRAEVRNLTGKTEITATRLFERLGDVDEIVHSAYIFHLLQQGVTFLHAAGLRDEHGNGVMIQGWNNMGKTSTSVSIARKYQCDFLGDDSVLIDGEEMYSYPRHIGMSPNTHFPNGELSTTERLERKIRSVNEHIPLKRFASFLPKGRMSVSPERLFSPDRVVGNEPVDISHCFFLQPPSPEGSVQDLASEKARHYGVINSYLKGEAADRPHHTLQAYQYLDTDIDVDMVVSKSVDLTQGLYESIDTCQVTTEKRQFTDTIAEEMGMSRL